MLRETDQVSLDAGEDGRAPIHSARRATGVGEGGATRRRCQRRSGLVTSLDPARGSAELEPRPHWQIPELNRECVLHRPHAKSILKKISLSIEIMNFFIKILKKIFPKKVFNLRHFFYAWYGAHKYSHPSKELFVIGITGTSGKSTSVLFLRQVLESAGYKVGSLSTIDFYIAGENKLNDQKMTMLGKMQTQKYLREMVDAGCDIAIVETTSEGRVQYRHKFIAYDLMVLTNLYPEHIESHGSFENYKKAKIDIFVDASTYFHGGKTIEKIGFKNLQKGCCSELPKVALLNGDSKYAQEFIEGAVFDTIYTFGTKKSNLESIDGQFKLSEISVDKKGLHFKIDDQSFDPVIYGEHNAWNCAVAVSIAKILNIDPEITKKAVNRLKNAPGRNEFIEEAEEHGFSVIVDYAFEPGAMKALYQVVELLEPERIIHVFGSTGGGRDIKRRFTVGEFVGEKADICIVTDEDPYDDDPMEIIDDVARAALEAGKVEDETLFKVLDRKQAIKKAIELAKKGDMILITGKGSEQRMCVAGGKMIPWDDREIARTSLKTIN